MANKSLKTKQVQKFDKWTSGRLRDVCELITDGSHFSPKEDPKGTHVIATVKDMQYNEFNFNTCKKISNSSFEELVKNGCSPQDQDILISKDGAKCLDLIFVYDSPKKIVVLSSIAIIRIKKNHNPWFFRYFLLASQTKKIMKDGYVSGSAIPRVILKDFKNVPIIIPSKREQNQISEIMKTLDKKIKNLQVQNQILEQLLEATYNSWFVDYDGITDFDNSELGQIPKGWKIKSILEIQSKKPGATSMGPFGSKIKTENYVESGVPIIRGKNIANGIVDNKNFVYLSEEKANELKNSNTHPEDIIITSQGSIGQVGIILKNSDFSRFVLSQNMMKVSCNTEEISPYYLYLFLKSSEGQRILLSNASSTGVPSIAQPLSYLRSIKLVIPDVSKMKIFHKLAISIFEFIDYNLKSVKKLENIRDSLLPKLMSGEIRV